MSSPEEIRALAAASATESPSDDQLMRIRDHLAAMPAEDDSVTWVRSLRGESAPAVATIPPDPARDARRRVRADNERRRAARALDAYITTMVDAPKIYGRDTEEIGEAFVAKVGDYVLARLGERDACPIDGSGDAEQESRHNEAGLGPADVIRWPRNPTVAHLADPRVAPGTCHPLCASMGMEMPGLHEVSE